MSKKYYVEVIGPHPDTWITDSCTSRYYAESRVIELHRRGQFARMVRADGTVEFR